MVTELTFSKAQALYEAHRGKDDADAVRAMVRIAERAEQQQIGWSRLRLNSLRELGRFLIRNGRRPGRPAKPCDAHNKPSLAALGIHDRHIAVNAKLVGRIPQTLFDRFLAVETEPTRTG
jgi:hypothetical protein